MCGVTLSSASQRAVGLPGWITLAVGSVTGGISVDCVLWYLMIRVCSGLDSPVEYVWKWIVSYCECVTAVALSGCGNQVSNTEGSEALRFNGSTFVWFCGCMRCL